MQVEYDFMFSIKYQLLFISSIKLSVESFRTDFLLYVPSHWFVSLSTWAQSTSKMMHGSVGSCFFYNFCVCLSHTPTHNRLRVCEENLLAGLFSRLMCCLSSAGLLLTAFEVNTQSFMLEDLCSPQVEEKSQRDISSLGCDMAMHTYVIRMQWNTCLERCRKGKANQQKTREI